MVFNPLSGRTHLLDIVTGQVLRLIDSGRSNVGGIRSEISAFLEVGNNDHLADEIAAILVRLEEAGLITRSD